MMRLCTFVFLSGTHLLSQDFESKCVKQLQEDKKVIQALKDLNKAQLEAINKSLDDETAELYWDGEQYYVKYTAEIPVYDLDENLKLIRVSPAKITKKILYEFKDDTLNDRPHNLIGNVFKFGGAIFYNKRDDKVYPDVMLMYEFFSFDKWFKFYGLSLNANVGLRHVGGSLAYQFVRSRWFRNTSLVFGYSYNFIDNMTSPFAGISLNF